MANLSNINNKFLVTTTGEVLVGRTAATGTSKLQVSGSLLIGTDINSGIPLVVQETTAAGFAIGFMRNTNATNGNGLVIDVNSTGGAYIQDWRQASTVKMRLLQNGNLGIGTDLPESKLAVKGTSGDADLFSISDVGVPTSGAEYGVAMIKTASTEFALNITSYSLTGKGVRIYNNGADAARTSFEVLQGAGSRFIVDGIGNVGIGTASPDVKLDIEGTGGEILRLRDTDGSYTALTLYNDATSTDSRNWGIFNNGYNYGDFNIVSSTTNTNAPDAATGTRLTITKDGNVGIGTEAPVSTWQATLDPSTGNSTFKLTSEGWIVTPYLTGLAGYYPGQGARPLIWGDIGGTNIQSWDNDAADGISLRSSNKSVRLFVREDGNVGIGTTGPSAKLDIAAGSIYGINISGTGQLQNAPTGNYDHFYTPRLRLGYMTGTNIGTIASNGGDSGISLITHSSSTGWKESLRVQPNGNVGIGTISPGSKLEVAGNITTPTQDLSSTATPTNFGVYSSEIRLIQTPNGGLKQCRVITDNYGEWILVGRFAANAMTTVQSTWSSESGLDTSTSQSTTTKFSADFGDSYPTEVRIMGATDFTKWRDTRTVDFVYGVPEGRQWKYFFSGGATNGMTSVGPNHSGNNKYGWGINGSYDGFGRWVNPIQTSVGMSDGNVTNPSAAYTTATANAFNWELASDAKITVSATRTFSGQDSYLTAGFGNDDNVQGFFDAYPSEVTNMQGGTGFSSAAWVLIKLPNFSSGYSGGVNQSEASLWTVKAIQSNVIINGTITLNDLTHTYTFNGPHALYISGGFTTTPTTAGVTYAAHFSMYVDGNFVALADQHDTPPEWWRQSFAFMTPNYTSGQHTITVTGTNQSGNFNIVGTTQYSQIVYRIIPL